jgi:hypothetical protein
MKYTIIIQVETSRKMEGSDEFLLCTAQRAGLKRRPAKAKVLQQSVTPGNCEVTVRSEEPPEKGLVAQVIKKSPKLAAAYKRLRRDYVKRSKP